MTPQELTISELAEILQPHMSKPAWPGLDQPDVKARAKRYARRLGIWDRIGASLDPSRDIPVVKRSTYRSYQRTGVRGPSQRAQGALSHQISLAAQALWLEHPAADLDYLQDLLWASCETSTWVMAAHERGCRVDLGSSEHARLLAEILHMFDDRLEAEVKDRVAHEIDRRVLAPVADPQLADWWYTGRMNWNAVCNANTIITALYRIPDPRLLAAYIHAPCHRIAYSLDGFADDGGCLEGPGYWNYGFGHYLDAAIALSHRTGGAVHMVDGDKIRKICRYPLVAHLAGSCRATFADSGQGLFPAEIMLKINRFFRMPELYELANRTQDGYLKVHGWRGLSLYRGEKAKGRVDEQDYVLPELGQIKFRVQTSTGPAVLAALAGRNDVPHNHNDVGSFVFFRKGRCVLTDPGGPVYTATTFGPRRYEILFCRSRGHSVPILNGREQPQGDYYGTLSVEELRKNGCKTAAIDMTHAYDEPTLDALSRTFSLAQSGKLTITDNYMFTEIPQSVEEGFMTYDTARVSTDGKTVTIGAGKDKVRLKSAGRAGRFRATRLEQESKEGRTGEVLTRITFVPSRRAKDMALVFEIT